MVHLFIIRPHVILVILKKETVLVEPFFTNGARCPFLIPSISPFTIATCIFINIVFSMVTFFPIPLREMWLFIRAQIKKLVIRDISLAEASDHFVCLQCVWNGLGIVYLLWLLHKGFIRQKQRSSMVYFVCKQQQQQYNNNNDNYKLQINNYK